MCPVTFSSVWTPQDRFFFFKAEQPLNPAPSGPGPFLFPVPTPIIFLHGFYKALTAAAVLCLKAEPRCSSWGIFYWIKASEELLFALGFLEKKAKHGSFQCQGSFVIQLFGRQRPTLQLLFLKVWKAFFCKEGVRVWGLKIQEQPKYKARGSGDQFLWDVGHRRMHLETMLYLKLKIKGKKQFNKWCKGNHSPSPTSTSMPGHSLSKTPLWKDSTLRFYCWGRCDKVWKWCGKCHWSDQICCPSWLQSMHGTKFWRRKTNSARFRCYITQQKCIWSIWCDFSYPVCLLVKLRRGKKLLCIKNLHLTITLF